MIDANPANAAQVNAIRPDSVLLGTVALEPNRWGLLSPDRKPVLCTADWLARAEGAGFDGIELWEHHATRVDEGERERLRRSRLPVSILNSYVAFDDDDDAARSEAARWVGALGAVGVKFNVGNDPGSIAAYTKRLARFAEKLPERTQLICECHGGTVAEDPAVAREILCSVGAADRLRALVHLGDDLETLDAMFGALGERICHVHVNFLRQGAPPLVEIADDVRRRVERIRANGFVGSYTIEFVNGVGSDRDQPVALIEAAVRDLSLLREVLGRRTTPVRGAS
jgi:sugar phosphate isomerase/epimerase